MSTVFIRNNGPEPIEVIDGVGVRTSMGEGTNNLFLVPIQIERFGGEGATQAPAADGPVDEPGAPVGDSDPDTEFEGLTLADANADLAGTPRPDNPGRTIAPWEPATA